MSEPKKEPIVMTPKQTRFGEMYGMVPPDYGRVQGGQRGGKTAAMRAMLVKEGYVEVRPGEWERTRTAEEYKREREHQYALDMLFGQYAKDRGHSRRGFRALGLAAWLVVAELVIAAVAYWVINR
jgi:hypothetical protein